MSFHYNLIHRVNVGDILRRSSSRYPHKLAIVEQQRKYSYSELNRLVNQAARALLSLGLSRGDKVAVLLSNSIEFLQVYFACAKTGITIVPVNYMLLKEKIEYIIKDSKSKAIIAESDFLEKIAHLSGTSVQHLIEVKTKLTRFSERTFLDWNVLTKKESGEEVFCYVEDRDIVQCIYTSGTTSPPKGVLTSHLAVYMNTLGTAFDLKFNEDDVSIAMMPFYHVAQINALTTPIMMAGGTTVIMKKFEPDKLLDVIEKEKATQIFGLPLMYRTLIEHLDIKKYDLSSLRLCVYAMAPMPDNDLRRALDVFDCDFALLFGQTEMSPVSAIFRPEHQLLKLGAVGTAAVNVDIAIMDKKGNILPPNEVGEIVYRSPQTMEGYLNDRDKSDVFYHGWFHSGDYGYIDQDQMLWFVDRKKDIVKINGVNISSIEIEKTIFHDPRVENVAIVGLPHAHYSEVLTAFIIPKKDENITEEEIVNFCHARLSSIKVPKRVIFVEQFPLTSTGRIQKHLLREKYKNLYYETI